VAWPPCTANPESSSRVRRMSIVALRKPFHSATPISAGNTSQFSSSTTTRSTTSIRPPARLQRRETIWTAHTPLCPMMNCAVWQTSTLRSRRQASRTAILSPAVTVSRSW
jgi:hypothetical protein